MNLKIRPFKTTVEQIQIEGVIEGEQLRLRLFRRAYPVRTASIGVDKDGPYALIHEMERLLDFEYTLRIEPEYDEHLPPECRIVVFRDKADGVRALLQQDGYDPDSMNLVGTVSESISAYFDCGGNIDGHGNLEPPPLESGDHAM